MRGLRAASSAFASQGTGDRRGAGSRVRAIRPRAASRALQTAALRLLDREPVELDPSHEIFRCVYRLKEKPQVPSIHNWQWSGQTWEDHGPGSETVHYRAFFDDKSRMVALLCHNTDLGDGWEREGENIDYFKEFSEKKAYPMGINIVTYAMTH